MCWLTAARAWASRVAADRSCWYGAVCFNMFSGVTARDSVTCVASGSSVNRTRDGSGTRTLTRARVRSSVKSSTPSSASSGRNSGSVASGSSRRAACRRCHRASTRAGESVNPSRGSWQVAQERPFPPGKGRKKLMAPCTTRPLARRDAASRPASVTSASICRSAAVELRLLVTEPRRDVPALHERVSLRQRRPEHEQDGGDARTMLIVVA